MKTIVAVLVALTTTSAFANPPRWPPPFSDAVLVPPPIGAPTRGLRLSPEASMATWVRLHHEPKSEWRDHEKIVYENFLTRTRTDILVVPFQVGLYGLDRATRSFMTAELALELTKAQKGTVANPYFVARVFGPGKRHIRAGDVYRLANRLGVKRVVWGFAGHSNAGKLKVEIRYQDRDPDGRLDRRGVVHKKDIGSYVFTDDRPPLEVYQSILPKMLAELGYHAGVLTKARPESTAGAGAFPASPRALPSPGADPIRHAYYLQLLGALVPKEADRTRERLFERSLLAVLQTSPRSRDYKVLKARAYMYLGYRPAALHVLGTPTTLEEKELVATLNGNLPPAERLAARIKSPVNKLFAMLDVHDMRVAYRGVSQKQSLKTIEDLDLPKAWNYLAYRRFTDWDSWLPRDNVTLERVLDKDYPVPGYSAKTVLEGRTALGRSVDDSTLQTMALDHVARVLSSDKRKRCCRRSSFEADNLDYLSVLQSIGIANLYSKTFRYTYLQGLPHRTIDFLDHLDGALQQHPALILARAEAQTELAKVAENANTKEALSKSAMKNAADAYYLEQGQSFFSRRAVGTDKVFFQFYYEDFPPKEYYQTGWSVHEYEARVKYTTSNFTWVDGLARMLRAPDKVNALLKSIENRFAGCPDRSLLIARLDARKHDYGEAEKYYREAIAIQPKEWTGYGQLAQMLVHEDRYDDASKVYHQYFDKAKGENPIGISNNANEAGSTFFWLGEFDLAKPFYNIAAQLGTGADSDFIAEMRLALLKGDYVTTAAVALRRGNRYHSTYAYRVYLGLLHVFGYSDQAWKAFDILAAQYKKPHVWETALVGHRLEGKSLEEIAAWAKAEQKRIEEQDNDTLPPYAARYVLRAGTTDRMPSKDLASLVEGLAHRRRVYPPGITAHRFVKGGRRAATADAQSRKRIKSDLTYFASAYYALRHNDFAGATKTFGEASRYYRLLLTYKDTSYMLPYYALAAARANDTAGIRALLDSASFVRQGFDYYLARGVLQAIAGHPKRARTLLLAGINRRPYTDNRPLFVEYEIAEICDMLYEATNDTIYRDLALDWARKTEKFQPWHAWPYAMEATLTTNAADRLRALGIGLHLDKNSERLKRFTKPQREAAMKWFKKNNPFRISRKRLPKAQI